MKDLFERALDAPAQERDALLARDGATESLQGEVRELLRQEAEIGEFLETPAVHRILGAPAGDAPLSPGDEISDFRVVGVLGEGGGGIVYEAEQREPRRRVALKLIRVRRHSGDVLRRFRDEAASLARLHHAAIAHVYSAGVCEIGGRAQPWIAMERIDGARSIVTYAREEALGRDRRLRLFADVCDALDHAHVHGVIHLDVTPGNVLVDAEGRPKVVDFGVACGLGGDDRAGGAPAAVGTLAYASPEQLTADRDAIDVRADVYGLGALLYELLTGTVPHQVDDLPVADAVRVKLGTAPAPPSARAPGIPRDLDAIALRALAADREQRYGSPAALARDVERFLANETVAAYRGGAWYHLGKFVRRRRVAALAIAGVAAAVIGGAGVSLWFAVDNARARDLAERRSYVAEVAAAASALRVDDIADARRRLDRAPAGLRDWEWRHLASRLDASEETVGFGERELRSGSASAEGELLALSGIDCVIDMGVRFVALARRDGTTVREWRFPGSGDVTGSSVSADGRWFAYGHPDGRVFLYDVTNATELPPIAAHTSWVIAIAFSPDGARLATASNDGSAGLWTRADRTLVHRFPHPDRVICVAFEPNGRRLATGCRDGVIRVWDTGSGELARSLPGHEGSVEGVAFSPDGTRLVSASRDRTVRLWNLDDGSVMAVGRTHSSNVRGVAFDPRGRCCVSASWDGTLRVWDARTGAETGLLRGHGSAVTSAAFLHDGSLLSFSLDHTVKRWNVERTDVPTCLERRDRVEALAFDPDGTRLAVAGNDGSLSILDPRTARLTARVQACAGAVRDVEFLGPGSLLLLPSGPELQVWDLPPGDGRPACVRRIPVPAGNSSMSVAAAGTWVWLAGRELTGVDLRSGAVETHSAPIQMSQIAGDGRGGLAVGSLDGAIGLRTAAGAWRSVRAGERSITSVAFDESGERIVAASADGTARVLRTSDLFTLQVLRGHSGMVLQAEFLPGGRRIVTVSHDRTVRLWDADDGENVLVLHEHGYPVLRVAVSKDGTRIATAAVASGNAQTAVKVWSAPAPAR